MEWSKFLSPEERGQLEELMEKAAEREKEQMPSGASNRFLLMKSQTDCLRQMEERDGTVQSRCIDDVQVLLKSICRFCREHGCYVCCRDMGQYAEPADNQR